MNTFGNLLRLPIKLNFGNVCRSFTSSITATVPKSPVVSNSKGFLGDSNNQKFLHSSFILKNIHGAQAKTFNAGISMRFMHVLSKQAEGSLNKIYESAYQKTSLTGSTAVRAHGLYHRFQNPSEIKRIRKHGYKARLRTKAGREIIMRRILKGRHVLTH